MASKKDRWISGGCWSYALALRDAMLAAGIEDPQLYDVVAPSSEPITPESGPWQRDYDMFHVVVRVGDKFYDVEGEHDAAGLVKRWTERLKRLRRLARTAYVPKGPLHLMPHSVKRARLCRVRVDEDDVCTARHDEAPRIVSLALSRRR